MYGLLTHLTGTTVGLIGLAAIGAAQIVTAMRLRTELRVARDMAGRLDRLAAALNLLTDTTEGGLAALTGEIERLSRRTVVMPAKDRKVKRDEFSQAALDAALAASEAHAHLGSAATVFSGEGHASLLA